MYETKDGYILVFYVLRWENLLRAIGREGLIGSPDYTLDKIISNPEVDSMIQEWAKTKTRKEAYELLSKEGVTCAPVQTIDEMFEDPRLRL